MDYGYETLEADLRQLLPDCRAYAPDTIIAVARGGLIAAQLLGYALEVRNIQVLRAASYDGDRQRDTVLLEGEVDLARSKRILVTEDIVDSGKTLQAVVAYLALKKPDAEIRTVAPWYKSSAAVLPDFTCREATEWIDFFWDALGE